MASPLYEVKVTYTNERIKADGAYQSRTEAVDHLERHTTLPDTEIRLVLDLVEEHNGPAVKRHDGRVIEVAFVPNGGEGNL
jgi:hypothetical protein